MNKNQFVFRLALLASAFVITPHVQAASGTWSTNASGDWADPLNWLGSTVADGAGAAANFSFTATGRIVTLSGTSQTVGILNIGTSTGAYSLKSSGGATLTMDNNGAQAEINQTASTLGSAISVPIQMTAGGLKITTAGGSSSLTVSGAISSVAEEGTQVLALTHGGSSLLTVSGSVSDGNTGGTVGVLIDGGIISIGGANTFTGGVTIRRGSLRGSPSGLGDGILQFGDASTGTAGILFQPGGGTYENEMIVDASGTGSVSIEGVGDFTGSLALGRGVIVNSNGGTINLSGNVSGAGGLTIGVNGNGVDRTVSLSGNNTFSGGLKTDGGSLLINIGSATAPGTGIWTIGPASPSAFSNASSVNLQIDNTSGAPLTLANNNPLLWSNFTFVGTDDLNLGTGNVTYQANGRTTQALITVLDHRLTVGGVISGASKGVGNAGAGTLALQGANTYTGPTSVGGILAVTSLANGGSPSNIGASSNVAANLLLNRGALQYTGGAVTTDRLFTIGNGGGTIESSGSGALQFTNPDALVSTNDVAFSGISFSATPATIINVGVVGSTRQLAVGQTISGTGIAPGTVVTQILDGVRIAISNPTTAASSTSDTYTFGALDRTLTLTGSNTGDNTLAGTLSDATANTLGVTKAGTGKWILSGANTYTGATTVSGGNLQLRNSTGSATGTGVVLLSGGISATVSGGGTSSGVATVSNGTRIAPGLNTTGANNNFGNAGTLGLGTTGGLTLTSANFDFDLASTATIGGGVNDLLTTGALTLAGSTVAFTFNGLNGTLATGAAYTLFQSTGIAGFNTAAFSTTFLGALAGNYAASYAQSGNDLQVTFTAIPEPKTWAMLMAGAGLLFIARRRDGLAPGMMKTVPIFG